MLASFSEASLTSLSKVYQNIYIYILNILINFSNSCARRTKTMISFLNCFYIVYSFQFYFGELVSNLILNARYNCVSQYSERQLYSIAFIQNLVESEEHKLVNCICVVCWLLLLYMFSCTLHQCEILRKERGSFFSMLIEKLKRKCTTIDI